MSSNVSVSSRSRDFGVNVSSRLVSSRLGLCLQMSRSRLGLGTSTSRAQVHEETSFLAQNATKNVQRPGSARTRWGSDAHPAVIDAVDVAASRSWKGTRRRSSRL